MPGTRAPGFVAGTVDGVTISLDDFPVELRKVVYTTNAIESLNARFRRAVRHHGLFPNEEAALKVVYLSAIQRRKNRSDMTGKINGWKTILNTLTVHLRRPDRPPTPSTENQ